MYIHTEIHIHLFILEAWHRMSRNSPREHVRTIISPICRIYHPFVIPYLLPICSTCYLVSIPITHLSYLSPVCRNYHHPFDIPHLLPICHTYHPLGIPITRLSYHIPICHTYYPFLIPMTHLSYHTYHPLIIPITH